MSTEVKVGERYHYSGARGALVYVEELLPGGKALVRWEGVGKKSSNGRYWIRPPRQYRRRVMRSSLR